MNILLLDKIAGIWTPKQQVWSDMVDEVWLSFPVEEFAELGVYSKEGLRQIMEDERIKEYNWQKHTLIDSIRRSEGKVAIGGRDYTRMEGGHSCSCCGAEESEDKIAGWEVYRASLMDCDKVFFARLCLNPDNSSGCLLDVLLSQPDKETQENVDTVQSLMGDDTDGAASTLMDLGIAEDANY